MRIDIIVASRPVDDTTGSENPDLTRKGVSPERLAQRGVAGPDSLSAPTEVRSKVVSTETAHKIIYEVTDTDTSKVICQVPSDQVLRPSENIANLLETAERGKHDLHS